jgi:hypothetical protein
VKTKCRIVAEYIARGTETDASFVSSAMLIISCLSLFGEIMLYSLGGAINADGPQRHTHKHHIREAVPPSRLARESQVGSFAIESQRQPCRARLHSLVLVSCRDNESDKHDANDNV